MSISRDYIPGITESSYNRVPYPKAGYEMSGIYRAYVEDDNDPLKVGRVKVRIPSMHGIPKSGNSNKKDKTAKVSKSSKKKKPGSTNKSTKRSTKQNTVIDTDGLPWAPVASIGAGDDQGSYLTPEVGTVVFVGFESGNPDLPVVLGGNYGTGKQYVDNLGYVKDDYNTNAKKSSKTVFKASNGKYHQSSGRNEVPDDGRRLPENKIIYKSPKGATISVIESDGKEELDIIDHAGQLIKMTSPFSSKGGEYNSGKRGKARVDKETAPDIGEVNDDKDAIFGIELYTTNGGTVKLTSTTDRKSHIVLSADTVEIDSADISTKSKIKVADPDPSNIPDKTFDNNDDYPFDDDDDDNDTGIDDTQTSVSDHKATTKFDDGDGYLDSDADGSVFDE